MLKFIVRLFKAPPKMEDPIDLSRRYSECQTRIAILRQELERMARPFMGMLDDVAQERTQQEEALAAVDLIQVKNTLRAEVVRSNELEKRLAELGHSAC
jgi:hypothetical protein